MPTCRWRPVAVRQPPPLAFLFVSLFINVMITLTAVSAYGMVVSSPWAAWPLALLTLFGCRAWETHWAKKTSTKG